MTWLDFVVLQRFVLRQGHENPLDVVFLSSVHHIVFTSLTH